MSQYDTDYTAKWAPEIPINFKEETMYTHVDNIDIPYTDLRSIMRFKISFQAVIQRLLILKRQFRQFVQFERIRSKKSYLIKASKMDQI